LLQENALFSGDHVMGWATTVVTPPDGDMRQYRTSLKKLRAREDAVYWPTHGAAIRNPHDHVDAFIRHRAEREAEILGRLAAGDETIPAMVEVLYADVDKRLHRAAAQSVLAHIEELVEDGRVIADRPPSVDAHFKLS
jgi:glyoxylase-like metal-dependent hydrolase (beta-lactamase superfamily II)